MFRFHFHDFVLAGNQFQLPPAPKQKKTLTTEVIKVEMFRMRHRMQQYPSSASFCQFHLKQRSQWCEYCFESIFSGFFSSWKPIPIATSTRTKKHTPTTKVIKVQMFLFVVHLTKPSIYSRRLSIVQWANLLLAPLLGPIAHRVGVNGILSTEEKRGNCVRNM